MDCSAAGRTVRVPLAENDPVAAVIVAVPVVMDRARPLALTVAMATDEDVQVTVLVKSWLVASLKVPVALNCCVAPKGIDAVWGVTARDTITAELTVKTVEPDMEPKEAEIVVCPTPVPVPWPPLLMAATPLKEDVQVTEAVRF